MLSYVGVSYSVDYTTPVKPAQTFVNKPKLEIASSQNGCLPRGLDDTFAHVTDVSIQNKSTLVVDC